MNVGLPPSRGQHLHIVTGGPSRCVWEEVPERSQKLERRAAPAGGSTRGVLRGGVVLGEDWTLEESLERGPGGGGSERGGVRTPSTPGLGGGVGSMQAGPRPPWRLLSQAHKCGKRPVLNREESTLLHGGWAVSLLSLEEWAQQVGLVRCSQPRLCTPVPHTPPSPLPSAGAPAPTVALGLTWHKKALASANRSPAEWKHWISEHLLSWLLDGLSVRTGSGFPFSALRIASKLGT